MEEIKKGDKFLCIADVVMLDTSNITYKFGHIYYSNVDGCITDDIFDVDHFWTLESADNYFIKIKH